MYAIHRAPRLAASLLAASCLQALCVSSASAQSTIPNPPYYQSVDENGVDVTSGTFTYNSTFLSIGPSGPGGLSYGPQTVKGVWAVDSWVGRAGGGTGGGHINVSFAGQGETFTYSAGDYHSDQNSGATVWFDGTYYVYTRADGTVITYDVRTAQNITPVWDTASVVSVKYPDGTLVKMTYKVGTGVVTTPNGSWNILTNSRLQSVANNHGYMLKYSYSDPTYVYLSKVTAINTGVDYCDPAADSCTLSESWPSVLTTTTGGYQDAYPVIGNLTNPVGDTTVFTTQTAVVSGAILLTAIKRPGATTADVTVSYDANDHVTSVTRQGVTFTYNYVVSGGVATMTRTDPAGHTRIYTTTLSVGRPSSVQNELGQTTLYGYDASGRLTSTTAPEGNKVTYTFGVRNNVTETRVISKTPGTPADVVTKATFDASCTNILTCNQPNATFDAKNNETDYTYSPTTGQVLTVTAPAAATGGVRPQTRYAYSSLQAYYKNSAGAIVASGQSISMPTGISSCATTASCTGTSDESKTTISYGPQTAGTANNLLPVSSTAASGDGALTVTTASTYDLVGNVLTVDGPLTGTADTSRIRYDADRRIVGAVSPDPDGTGPRKFRAARMTYNSDGQLTLAEVGTVNSQSDADWSGLTVLQKAAQTYDSNGRLIQSSSAGATGSNLAEAQYGYDSFGRLDCAVTRMNPTVFTAAPGACVLGTAGAFGPDRIVKYGYDALSRVAATTQAFGLTEAATDSTGYTTNGRVASVTDAEGNKTTYEYDGVDRLLKARYPVTTKGAGTSSTTDYEELLYDAGSNVSSRRLRGYASDSTRHIDYTYDNLGRISAKDLPGSEPDVSYAYDLLGQMTGASQADNALTFGYDALGRNTSRGGPLGSVAYQYDAAGRRTRMTWPDGFYITYDYQVTGEVTAIHENGATSGVGVLATYTYDDLGKRGLLTRGNGTTTSYGFDAVSRLSSLTQNLTGTANDLTLNFNYNPASQITSNTRSNDLYAWDAHYNVNRSYANNGLNQATAAGATSLQYDARGNLTVSGSTAYTYSSENLLTNGAGLTLDYDPALRLYAFGVTGAMTRYLYDGVDRIAEYDSTGAVTRRHVFGPGGDEPLVWYAGSGTTTRRWLHADERGSVIAVSDDTGTSLATNKYDEFGIPSDTLVGRFGFTGQAWLPTLGMWYYKARIYSPTLGRFMQTDPIGYGDGLNWYNYVGSDPVNGTDPGGLAICTSGGSGFDACTGYNAQSNFVASSGSLGFDPFFDTFVQGQADYYQSMSALSSITFGHWESAGGTTGWDPGADPTGAGGEISVSNSRTWVPGQVNTSWLQSLRANSSFGGLEVSAQPNYAVAAQPQAANDNDLCTVARKQCEAAARRESKPGQVLGYLQACHAAYQTCEPRERTRQESVTVFPNGDAIVVTADKRVLYIKNFFNR